MSKVNSLIAKFESVNDNTVPVPSVSKINSASAKGAKPILDKKDKFLTAVFEQHLQAAHGKLVKATNRVGRLTSHLEQAHFYLSVLSFFNLALHFSMDQAHSTIVVLKRENERLKKETDAYYEKYKKNQQRAIRAERCLLKDPVWSGFFMERAIRNTEEMKRRRQQEFD